MTSITGSANIHSSSRRVTLLVVPLYACCALQGTYKPAAGGEEVSLATTAEGQFVVQAPALATYWFMSTAADVCVDAVSKSRVAFPLSITLPPLASATVTAISLLTVPARADTAMQAKYGSMAEVVPVDLWTEVYGMFGYAADAEVSLQAAWMRESADA